jgi:hypothetical protein
MQSSDRLTGLLTLGIIIALYSCTEPVDIILDSSFSRLVVFGEISTDTTSHKIKLSRSANYFYNKPAEGVTDAIVKINDGVKEEFLTEDLMNPGIYETSPGFFGVPGRTYSLFIQNVDIDKDGVKESYSATSYLPSVSPVDSIKIQYAEHFSFVRTQILLYTRDPSESLDFYMFKVAKNGILQTDSLRKINVQSDELFNGNYINGIEVQHLSDHHAAEIVAAGDIITLEMYGITKEYFKFLIEAQTELFGSNPLFSGPPANISTNLSNGASGFFAAVSVKRATVNAPPRK